MKTSILKASKKGAEQVSADLLSKLTSKGNPIFKREETESGFQIYGLRKVEGQTERQKDVVFIFEKKKNGLCVFHYNEKLLTF